MPPSSALAPCLFVTVPWSQELGSSAEVLVCPQKRGGGGGKMVLPCPAASLLQPALALAESCCFMGSLVPPRTRGWGQGHAVDVEGLSQCFTLG